MICLKIPQRLQKNIYFSIYYHKLDLEKKSFKFVRRKKAWLKIQWSISLYASMWIHFAECHFILIMYFIQNIFFDKFKKTESFCVWLSPIALVYQFILRWYALFYGKIITAYFNVKSVAIPESIVPKKKIRSKLHYLHKIQAEYSVFTAILCINNYRYCQTFSFVYKRTMRNMAIGIITGIWIFRSISQSFNIGMRWASKKNRFMRIVHIHANIIRQRVKKNARAQQNPHNIHSFRFTLILRTVY